MKELTSSCRQANEVILAWLNQSGPLTQQQLLANWFPTGALVGRRNMGLAENISGFVDRMLPLAWNFNLNISILFGSDLADVARELARRGQTRIVLFLEDQKTIENLPSLITVVRNEPELLNAMDNLSSPLPETIIGKSLLKMALSRPKLEYLTSILENFFRNKMILNFRQKHFAKISIPQTLSNLNQFTRWPLVSTLKNRWQKKPIVLIAPGPSLAKNIDLIQSLKGKALLLAYSKALAPLKKKDIIPDIVQVVAPSDICYHFDDYPVEQLKAVILSGQVNPKVLELNFKQVFLYNSETNIAQWLDYLFDKETYLHSSVTVATAAFSLAKLLGCDPIILVGHDLAFQDGRIYDHTVHDKHTRVNLSDDNKTFTIKGWSQKANKMDNQHSHINLTGQEEMEETRGYFDKKVLTFKNWSITREFLEDSALEIKEQVRIINSTEGGAYIDNMEHIPLKTVVEQFDFNHIQNWEPFSTNLLMVSDKEKKRKYLKKEKGNLKLSFKKCLYLARQCARLNQSSSLPSDKIKRLLSFEDKLLRALKPALTFIYMHSENRVIDTIKWAHETTIPEERFCANHRLYQAVIKACTDGNKWLE